MKNILLALLFLSSLTGCNLKSKRDYKYTIAKDNHLYIEIYRTSIINSSVAAYLTDSLTFNQNLGQYDDEKGYIDCTFKGDSVIAQRKEYAVKNGKPLDNMKTMGTQVYSLRALKGLRNLTVRLLPNKILSIFDGTGAPINPPLINCKHISSLQHKNSLNVSPSFSNYNLDYLKASIVTFCSLTFQ